VKLPLCLPAALATFFKRSLGTISGYGERFEAAGFGFTRVGKRKGGQMAWQVSRLH